MTAFQAILMFGLGLAIGIGFFLAACMGGRLFGFLVMCGMTFGVTERAFADYDPVPNPMINGPYDINTNVYSQGDLNIMYNAWWIHQVEKDNHYAIKDAIDTGFMGLDGSLGYFFDRQFDQIENLKSQMAYVVSYNSIIIDELREIKNLYSNSTGEFDSHVMTNGVETATNNWTSASEFDQTIHTDTTFTSVLATIYPLEWPTMSWEQHSTLEIRIPWEANYGWEGAPDYETFIIDASKWPTAVTLFRGVGYLGIFVLLATRSQRILMEGVR